MKHHLDWSSYETAGQGDAYAGISTLDLLRVNAGRFTGFDQVAVQRIKFRMLSQRLVQCHAAFDVCVQFADDRL